MRNLAKEYQFLSLCLLYPEADLTAQLRQFCDDESLSWAAAMVDAFGAESMEALQIEHTRLFVNNAAGVPCPPYESAYTEGYLLSPTTARVAAFYAEWGVSQSLETADYLPVELQFAAQLFEQGSKAVSARREFERGHLHRWLPKFSADLQSHAELEFYRQTGYRLAQLVN